MKGLIIPLLALLLVLSCGKEASQDKPHNNPPAAPYEHLKSLSGKTIFQVAAFIENKTAHKNINQRQKIIQELENTYHFNCINRICTITLKDK